MLVEWSRVFPAVVTPFKDDLSIDFAALEAHLERLIAAGVPDQPMDFSNVYTVPRGFAEFCWQWETSSKTSAC